MLTLLWQLVCNAHIYRNITMYILNLHNATRQLDLSKAGKE